jgi:hypothetical protein
MERYIIYELIDREREYQDAKWGPSETKGKHSVEEFLYYVEDYLAEVKHVLSRDSAGIAYKTARKQLPKIAAMLVACMEQNGAEGRE